MHWGRILPVTQAGIQYASRTEKSAVPEVVRGLAAICELDFAFAANGTLSMIENLPKQDEAWHEFYVLRDRAR